MTADQVQRYVEDQIADRWDQTNSHNVDLRASLIRPREMAVINRSVVGGKLVDSIYSVWIVLEETSDNAGYLIFFDESDASFGLADSGFGDDEHPVICGYYGDFWTAFKGM